MSTIDTLIAQYDFQRDYVILPEQERLLRRSHHLLHTAPRFHLKALRKRLTQKSSRTTDPIPNLRLPYNTLVLGYDIGTDSQPLQVVSVVHRNHQGRYQGVGYLHTPQQGWVLIPGVFTEDPEQTSGWSTQFVYHHEKMTSQVTTRATYWITQPLVLLHTLLTQTPMSVVTPTQRTTPLRRTLNPPNLSKVITLNLDRPATRTVAAPSDGGVRQSPVTHQRRGHWRRNPNGQAIWIAPTMVLGRVDTPSSTPRHYQVI